MMQQIGDGRPSVGTAAHGGGPASPMSTTSSPGSDDDEVSAFKRKTGHGSTNNNTTTNDRDLESMKNSVSDIHQRLKVQRQMAGRPYELENMDQEQVRLQKS